MFVSLTPFPHGPLLPTFLFLPREKEEIERRERRHARARTHTRLNLHIHNEDLSVCWHQQV